MPAPIVSRNEIMKGLLQIFRTLGYPGTTLSEISKKTGLGKASLYHYFPGGKQDMAEATLKDVISHIEDNIFTMLLDPNISTREKFADMAEKLTDFYSNGRDGCVIGVFSVGESKGIFQTQLKKVLSRWVEILTELLIKEGISKTEAKNRAEDFLIRVQGSLIISSALKSTDVFSRGLDRSISDLLKRP